MVENLPCHVHLRIDKRREARLKTWKPTYRSSTIPALQPVPPFFSPKKYRSGFSVPLAFFCVF